MKKIITGLLLFAPMMASAQDANFGIDDGALINTGLGTKGLKETIGAILNVLLTFLGIIAVLIIILLTITIGPFNPLLHIQSDSEDSKLFSYIQEHTSEKEIFLIPVHLRKFRTSTNRPVVIDISFPFTDTGNIRWYLIIKDISNNYINEPQQLKDKNRINEGYHSLTKKKLIELKEKYKFDYVIYEKPKKVELNILYENDKFIVYKI